MQATQTTIAASYERVSTGPQARQGYSLRAQRWNAAEFAGQMGWTLPPDLVFTDAGESGADWDLPGLSSLFDAARSKRFETLIVPDHSRFARNMVKALILEEELRKLGVRVVYQSLPLDDTPEARMVNNQFHAFSEYEREKILWRTMQGKRQKLREGKVGVGGPAPYGYRYLRDADGKPYALDLDDDAAHVMRRLFADLITTSTHDVAAVLNREGIPTPSGTGRWTGAGIRNLVIDPVYMGVWVWGKRDRRVDLDATDTVKIDVPAIVSRKEWERLQAVMVNRRAPLRGQKLDEDDLYLLRGVLQCGYCKERLQVQPNRGTRYYRCQIHCPYDARRRNRKPCPMPDVYAVDIEAEIWQLVSDALLDEVHLQAGVAAAQQQYERTHAAHRERIASIDKLIRDETRRIDGIAERIATLEPGLLLDAVARQAKEIEQKIGALRAERDELANLQLDGISPETALSIMEFAKQVRDGLTSANHAERRRILRMLQVRGTVRLDPDGNLYGRKHRFAVEWDAALPLLNTETGVSRPVSVLTRDMGPSLLWLRVAAAV